MLQVLAIPKVNQPSVRDHRFCQAQDAQVSPALKCFQPIVGRGGEIKVELLEGNRVRLLEEGPDQKPRSQAQRNQADQQADAQDYLLPRWPFASLAFLQRLDDLAHRLKAVLWPLDDHSLEHGVQGFGNLEAHLSQRRHRTLLMGQYLLDDRLTFVEWLAGQKKEESAAQAVNIGAVVGSPGFGRLFWCQVIHRPHQGFFAGWWAESGQSQVQDFDDAIRSQDEIARLD